MQQHRQNAVARPSSIDIDAKGLPSPNYNESPYGNGNIGDLQPRGGDFRYVHETLVPILLIRLVYSKQAHLISIVPLLQNQI